MLIEMVDRRHLVNGYKINDPTAEQRGIYKQNIEKPLQLTSEFTLKKLPGVLGCFPDLISCGFIHSLRLLVVRMR